MPSSPASTARRSMRALTGPKGRAQPSTMGTVGRRARAWRKKAPISSGLGGLTSAIGVPHRGVSTTSTRRLSRWRATISRAACSPSMRP